MEPVVMPVIEQDHYALAHVDHQVRRAIVIDFGKTERHGQAVIGHAWPRVDVSVGWIACGQLDHLDLSMQVERHYVGFPPVSLRNLKGIEQKTAHNAS